MEDHDFQVVRKNLNILSVLILMLAYTNAQMDKLNFLGIDMDLAGAKFYQALFIGYLYFIWRYWTKLNFKGGFWNDFMNYYLDSEYGVKKQYTFKRYAEEFKTKSPRLKRAIEEKDENFRLLQLSIIRLGGWPITRLRLSGEFTSKGDGTSESTPTFNVFHDINVPIFFLLRKLVLFCLKEDKFGDYLFPFIPVIINALFFFLKRDWQGGIYLIFG